MGGTERPLVLGHRGASAEAPENTLSAFRLALAEGADGVELDVWRCGSGEIVVHHDADTGRTAGRALSLAGSSLRALRELDVGARQGERYRGERIPLLEEVLEAFPGAVVNVEMKSGRLPDLGLASALADLLRRRGDVERCLVSSFDPVLLAAVRVRAPWCRTGWLVAAEGRWRLRELLGTRFLRPRAIHPESALVTPARAERWRRMGLDVNVWTVDRPEEALRLRGLGVAALITNRPAALRAALGPERR